MGHETGHVSVFSSVTKELFNRVPAVFLYLRVFETYFVENKHYIEKK